MSHIRPFTSWCDAVSGLLVPFVVSSFLARFWPAVRHLWQAATGRLQEAWHSRGSKGDAGELKGALTIRTTWSWWCQLFQTARLHANRVAACKSAPAPPARHNSQIGRPSTLERTSGHRHGSSGSSKRPVAGQARAVLPQTPIHLRR